MANPVAIQTIDLALRGGVVLLMLLAAALLLRDYARAVTARLGAAFAFGVAAYASYSAPGFAAEPGWWQAPIIALSAGNPLVLWLVAKALFDDTFEVRAWHGVLWWVLAASGVFNCLVLIPSHASSAAAIGTAHTLALLLFAVLALRESLASWRADLIEGRRWLRGFVVAVAAFHALVVGVSQLMWRQSSEVALASALNAASLAAISLVVVWFLVRTVGDDLFLIRPARADRARAPQRPGVARTDEAPDASVLDAIDNVMTAERAYREPSLTIGALAARLGLLEYKLRRAINQGLGYRNFNVFLNRYRIAQAKAVLADPSEIDAPVLTVAMDCGFQSLGPFNRAFKAETGMTPTEFRRLHASVSRAEITPRLADSEIDHRLSN
jgi:AraC-like DNA-binding protein